MYAYARFSWLHYADWAKYCMYVNIYIISIYEAPVPVLFENPPISAILLVVSGASSAFINISRPAIVSSSFRSHLCSAFEFVMHSNDSWRVLHRQNRYVQCVQNSLDYRSSNDRYADVGGVAVTVIVVDENSRRTIVTKYRR